MHPNRTDCGVLITAKDMSKYDFMSDEQYYAASLEFKRKFNPPVCQRVSCLNLIMRREFAEAIVRGEKKVETRSFSPHYDARLTDKAVDRWMTEHRDDKNMDKEAFNEFMCATRNVEKIHFHNYNNTWFLDVECTENGLVGVTPGIVKDLQIRFDFHDWDSILADCERRKDPNRPLFYYFVIGEILDTNLR